MDKIDGITYLKQQLKSAPSAPGVYRMLNARGEVLYVGKAKNLKNRLTNYTQEQGLSHRIRKMVFETRQLVLVEVSSEQEALLLEISLIKSLKPKYNVLFRDDTSYPYILIAAPKEGFPARITKHRGAKKTKGDYFGPYPGVDAMYKTMDLMERAFLIRTCKDAEYKNRTRPCLKYHIKRCSAPCVAKIGEAAYADLVQQAKDFLRGKTDDIQTKLQEKMMQASEAMQFEEAAVHRDRLKAIASVLGSQSTFVKGVKDADIVALYREAGQLCVQVFSYRGGRHIGNAAHFPTGLGDETDAEVMRLFLAMHYEKLTPPREIIVSHLPEEAEALASALTPEYQVQINKAQRGARADILKQACINAQTTLSRKLAQKQNWAAQMAAFGDVLKDERPMTRVETFDISNISGKQPVASLVVAGEDGMLKGDYRKFKIKSMDTPDDYAMMRETLTRRYSRLIKESDKALKEGAPTPPWPDVIMVDGGKGHLRVLVEVAHALGLSGENGPILCAIAKGEERDKGLEVIFKAHVQPTGAFTLEELDIPHNTPLIFVLQRIRDESHRFAIGFHRQQRSKLIEKSALDQVPGIGPKRKKALLLAFGSAQGVRDAAIKDLKRVDGISDELAEEIYAYFHG